MVWSVLQPGLWYLNLGSREGGVVEQARHGCEIYGHQQEVIWLQLSDERDSMGESL